jgi:hypothetical protein
MSVAIAYNLQRASELTGLSVDFLRRAIKAPAPDPPPPARLAGSRYIILASDLEEWMRNRPEA